MKVEFLKSRWFVVSVTGQVIAGAFTSKAAAQTVQSILARR